MTPPEDAKTAVAARFPGAATLGLLVPSGSRPLPATALADAAWTLEHLERQAVTGRTGDRRVLGTLWWYSASLVLLGPALAGLVAGWSWSARLADTTLHVVGDLPWAATATASTGDVVTELRDSLGAVVAAVADAGGVREAPLRAITTDALANELLALGRARGDVPAVAALAGPLARAARAPVRRGGRAAVDPPGVLLPDLAGAPRGAVHVVPAAGPGRTSGPAGGHRAPDAQLGLTGRTRSR